MASQFYRSLKRSFRKQKLRTFLTIFIIGLTIIVYFGFSASGESLVKSQEEMYNQLNFDDLNVLLLGFNDDLDEELKDQFDNIEVIEDRLYFYTKVKIDDDNFNCILIGINSSQNPKVNSLKVRDGSYFNQTGRNNTDVLLIKEFADAHGLLNNNLTFNLGGGDVNLTVRASVSSPEYVYIFDPDTVYPIKGNMGVAYFDIDYLRELLFLPDSFSNNLVMTFKDESIEDDTMEEINDYLEDNYYYITNWMPSDTNPSNLFVEEEILQWQSIVGTIGFFFLFVSFMIIFSNMNRYVFEHKRQIGTLKAIGVTNKRIIFEFIRFILLLWLIGAILGFILGYILGLAMQDIYGSFMDFVFPVYVPSIELYTFTLFNSLAVTMLSPFYALIKISRTMPVEALQTAERLKVSKKSYIPRFERFIRFITRGHISSTTSIALRNVFLKKRRAFLVLISLTFGFTLSATILYLTNSVYLAMYDAAVVGEPWDYHVSFSSDQLGDDSQIEDIYQMNEGNISRQDKYVLIQGQFEDYSTGDNFDDYILVYGVYPNFSHFDDIKLIEGSLFTSSDGNQIILGKNFGLKFGVGVGDYIKFSRGSYTYTLKIIGFHNEMWQFKSYMPVEMGQSMLDVSTDKFSGIYFQCNNSDEDIEDQIRLIENKYGNTAGLSKSIYAESTAEMIMEFFGLIIVCQVVAFMVSYLIITNIININIREHSVYFSLLKTQGHKKVAIFKMIVIEHIILIILMLIAGLIIGSIASSNILDQMSKGIWSMRLGLSWELTITFLIEGFIISFVSLIPGSLSAMRLETKTIIREKLNW